MPKMVQDAPLHLRKLATAEPPYLDEEFCVVDDLVGIAEPQREDQTRDSGDRPIFEENRAGNLLRGHAVATERLTPESGISEERLRDARPQPAPGVKGVSGERLFAPAPILTPAYPHLRQLPCEVRLPDAARHEAGEPIRSDVVFELPCGFARHLYLLCGTRVAADRGAERVLRGVRLTHASRVNELIGTGSTLDGQYQRGA